MPNRSWFKPGPGPCSNPPIPVIPSISPLSFFWGPRVHNPWNNFFSPCTCIRYHQINGSSCIEGIGMGTTSNVGDALLISVPNWIIGIWYGSGERSHLQQQVEQDRSVLTWHMTLAALCLTSGSWGALVRVYQSSKDMCNSSRQKKTCASYATETF